jgi:type IV pilus assembly protein PilZ
MAESPKLQSIARPAVLSLNINTKAALFSAYMPFLKRGGLFVPTAKPYSVGDEVFMLLSLMDEPGKLPIAGAVVWVTPGGAQGNKTQGIGVHFSDDESGQAAKGKIESLLGGLLGSSKPSHTL